MYASQVSWGVWGTFSRHLDIHRNLPNKIQRELAEQEPVALLSLHSSLLQPQIRAGGFLTARERSRGDRSLLPKQAREGNVYLQQPWQAARGTPHAAGLSGDENPSCRGGQKAEGKILRARRCAGGTAAGAAPLVLAGSRPAAPWRDLSVTACVSSPARHPGLPQWKLFAPDRKGKARAFSSLLAILPAD